MDKKIVIIQEEVVAIKPIKNPEIAKTLKELSAFLTAEGVAFKPRAYEKVSQGIASM